MPLDTTATEAASIRGARPFVAHQRPPRIVFLGDDEEALSECEAQWIGQRGAIAPKDGDQSDRWDDDERPPPRAAHRGLGMDGLTAATIAVLPDLPDRATLRALMVAAGHLTYAPKERRYLLSAAAIREGVGRNVRPRRGFRFPVFFSESVAMIVRSLDWGHIKERLAALPTERERRDYLARWHRLNLASVADLRIELRPSAIVVVQFHRSGHRANQRLRDAFLWPDRWPASVMRQRASACLVSCPRAFHMMTPRRLGIRWSIMWSTPCPPRQCCRAAS